MSVLDIADLKLPKTIYSADSEFNGQIDVVQAGNTRKLRVDRIDQSLNHDSKSVKNLVWGQVLDVLKQNEPLLKNILILGLGGATIQHLISKEYPDAYITSIDIDPVMHDVARKYFYLDDIQNHKVIIEDACRVLIEPTKYDLLKESFQAVLVDIYVGETFPELGRCGNFISAVKTMVLPGGLVMINRIYTKHHQEDVDEFVDFVEQHLHDVKTVTVPGYTNSDNLIIFGRK